MVDQVINKKVLVKDLGMMPYREAWDYQEEVFGATVQRKLDIRNGVLKNETTVNHLLLCEHPPVVTLGKSGEESNLLVNPEQAGIEFYKINRGGDITFHGPGQIVMYPILDLDHFFSDIHKYLRLLEACVIETLKEYKIEAGRLKGATGVWLEPNSPSRARKICAIGIRCSRWVTMHGLAFNVNTDLDYFNHIIPCGIGDKQVSSLQKELGSSINIEEVKGKLLKHFEALFDAELVQA